MKRFRSMFFSAKAAVHVLAIACIIIVAIGVNRIIAAEKVESKSESVAAPQAMDEASIAFFENRIRPTLVEHCYKCHSTNSEKLKGELFVDSREGLLKGGEVGPSIVPGHPEQSKLIEAITYKNVDLQMPPKGKLTDEQINDLTTWVKSGSPWPVKVGETKTVAGKAGFDIQKRKSEHWAWKPVVRPAVPTVKNADWAKDDVDRFVIAALEAKGLTPAMRADRNALIRRAYFDLIGLPPGPAVVDAFVADQSPDAFAKVVDRLLASPQYGERWARHWMDLARYAESYGHEFDYNMEHAWQYRDYLIRAFNVDLPYNDLATEQIAGDLLEKPRQNPEKKFNESIIGTGFWWLCEQVHSPVDVMQHQSDRIDNQIDTMGKTFLGLTLGCARCHDHKFDAISQKDVYALWGFIEGSRRQEALLDPGDVIGTNVSHLRQLHADAGRILRKGLSGAATANASAPLSKSVEAYLLAARKVSHEKSSVASTAKEMNLEPAQLEKWIAALANPTLKQIHHPMHAWSVLENSENRKGFDAAKTKLQTQFANAQKVTDDALANSVLFKDFSDGNYNGWYVTGESFGNKPAVFGDWDSVNRKASIVTHGAAHSGMLSGKVAGVLRSPDFILKHNSILYRIKGQGGQVRLIVDGFTMDVFNKLLFHGHEFKVKQDQYTWVRQVTDIAKHIGHRAHIEINDHGDGWLGVEQIRFADDKINLAIEPNAAAIEIIADPKCIDVTELAKLFANKIVSAAIALDTDKPMVKPVDAKTQAAAELLNWVLENQLIDLPKPQREPVDSIAKQMDEIAGKIPGPMRVIAMADGDAVEERIYLRGSHKTLGDTAPRRFIEAISGREQPSPGNNSGRLFLAKQLTDPANPLFARVMVNRIWHHLFGRGIVPSTDNFGVLGTPPTHPELLDFLSDRFVKNGYSIKQAIRALMLTSTYQMSSTIGDARAEEIDPQNLLLHRASVRRLEGEAIRDQVLSISGRLDLTQYGPSVPIHLTTFMEGRGRPEAGPLDGGGRRSVYVAVKRNFLSPMMLAFDTPIPFACIGRRNVSNVPAQALIMMNDPFIVQQAQLWAKSILAAKDQSPEQRIELMYLKAYSRKATIDEIKSGLEFFQQQGEALNVPAEQRLNTEALWSDYAHVLMNLKEFIFLR